MESAGACVVSMDHVCFNSRLVGRVVSTSHWRVNHVTHIPQGRHSGSCFHSVLVDV